MLNFLQKVRCPQKQQIGYTSLFCSAGIGETYLRYKGFISKVANEFDSKRSAWYKGLHPECDVITGDITDPDTFNKIVLLHKKNHCVGVIASPVCRDFSLANCKRNPNSARAHLYEYVLQLVEEVQPLWVMIENSDQMSHTVVNGEIVVDTITHALQKMGYNVNHDIQDSAYFGTPQHRRRTIILAHKEKVWSLPKPQEKTITLKDVIGDLPSLEIGQKSTLKWHDASMFTWSKKQIAVMAHTPSGKSAHDNPKKWKPINVNGKPSKAHFKCSFQRRNWDDACNTILQDSKSISGFRTVHPGRLLPDGTYSDARPLTILEMLRVTGLPDDYPIPTWASDNLIRQVLGDCFAPRHVQAIFKRLP